VAPPTCSILVGGDVPVTPAEVDAVRMAARDLLGVSNGRPCGWPKQFLATTGRASSAKDYPRRLPSTKDPLALNYKTGPLERRVVDPSTLCSVVQ
jgi:hypothetical protein